MIKYAKKTKILLTGGGTGGSVSPLLAVAHELGDKDYKYLWIGARRGPERKMVAEAGIKFQSIAAGKLRRYFSLHTIVAPLFVLIGFIQAFFIILKFRPKWIITAGSFVSVPVVWAGWLLRRKILVHQQDVIPGLANTLMAPFARVVTVTFEKSLEDYGDKAQWIGNPVGAMRASPTKKFFKLKKDLPVMLILGGGTGARFINDLVKDSLDDLTKFCQIIHVTGKNKKVGKTQTNYHSHEFLNSEQMAEAYHHTDIVVSRCGMSTLTELSYLGKPSILIPIPNSHQVDNARIFEEHSAAVVLDQPVLEQTFFVKNIKEILEDEKMQKELSENIKGVIKKGANEELAKIIERE